MFIHICITYTCMHVQIYICIFILNIVNICLVMYVMKEILFYIEPQILKMVGYMCVSEKVHRCIYIIYIYIYSTICYACTYTYVCLFKCVYVCVYLIRVD